MVEEVYSASPATSVEDERSALAEAAGLLASGGTVAFPTETVYGLGADARNTAAVEAIFAAKGRPSDNPLIVHIADISQLEGLVTEVNETARRLMEAFWPGPLTLVLPVAPGAVSPRERLPSYRADCALSLGRESELETAAHRLYAALRRFDECGVTYILAESCPEKGLGSAVMNRLLKAAGHQVIDAGESS
nr:L-threonylcarbamoyladenylate synthase [Paenibacillus senegalimassiliensis]